MPPALISVGAFATVAAAGTSVVTPAPGDSVAIPSFDLSAKGYLENVSVKGASIDWVRVRSPRMHDANQGIRMWVGGTQEVPLLPFGYDEVLYPSDVPTVEIDQTAAASGVILLQYGFSDLPGYSPRFGAPADVAARTIHISGVEVDVTSGAIGNWGNGAAINSSFDNFEAGSDYALLGMVNSVAVGGVSIVGQDTSNARLAVPGSTDPRVTRDWFVRMSNETGRNYIPIIAANNKGSTMVQCIDSAAATATKVTLVFAQLG